MRCVRLSHSIASARVRLSAEEVATLDAVSQLPAEYPGWMLEFQGAARVKPPVKE